MVRRPEIGQEVVLWRRGWLAPTPTVRRDPLSIGVGFLVNIGWTGAISGIGATIVGSVILGAAALGVSLLSSALFTPQAPQRTSSERQATLRQSLGPRVRSYGRVKVGGTLWFFETKSGDLYSALTINEGKISSVVEHWLNDQKVTLDGSNRVTQAPYVFTFDGTTYRAARIYMKDGDSAQTVHSVLDAAFTEITTAHRFRGTANALTVFQEVPAEKVPEVYPQLNPSYRAVIDASLVKSVRTGSTIWSDNPADAIYDYLTGVDGAGYAYGAGYAESQVNLESFQDFADTCDELVDLKAGGTIKRYRLWGSYGMNEEMRAVLPRMLRACDGDLYMDTSGRIAIRGGKWTAPELTLDADSGHIISAQFKHGQGALAAFNDLTLSYTDPDLDYQETEAQSWVDTGNITLRGQVLPQQLDLLMVPHHAQARRIGKIFTRRGNPEWVGTLVTNFYGFNAIGEETVHVVFPPLGIDDDFLIQSVRILDDLSGVEISVTSFGASAYDWDAELEEGEGPGEPPETSSPVSLDPPEGFHVAAALRAGTILLATWTEPDRTALEQEVQYRSSPDGTWVNMLVSDGVGLAETGIIVADEDYDVRIRTRSPGGTYGDWSDPPLTVTATAVATAPDPVTGVTGTAGVGQVVINFTFSASDNAIGANIYRHTADDFGAASLVTRLYGSPSVVTSFTDSDLTAGTYYYWVTAINGSTGFVESTEVATGAQVVT